MLTKPHEFKGAALIAPTYHITVKALEGRSYFSNIRAVEQATPNLLTHQHRLPHDVVGDYLYRTRLFERSQAAVENENEIVKVARDIRNLAQQRGERVPNDKEARAMASISFYGKGIAMHAQTKHEYGVENVKSFDIFCERKEGLCVARLFVGGDSRVIEIGQGRNHLEAIHELEKKVGPRAMEREQD